MNIPEALSSVSEEQDDIDPIHDIIDYLVRCANISFKNAHLNESGVRTIDKIHMAYELYNRSATDFLLQFGKHLAPYHIKYFEDQLPQSDEHESYRQCVDQLKLYHSDDSRRKRIRNRRFKALQNLKDNTDYFSEKEMMYRNPLLYDQLVGQYLTDDEIRERDGVDSQNLTFLNMILDTVDRNDMREKKNEQMLEENLETVTLTDNSSQDQMAHKAHKKKQWGDFETPDTQPSYIPEPRTQNMITAPERDLLRQEFLQEMYNSFIEGRDIDIDYNSIDNDEQYDDLQQVSQDAEDRYFDSECNDSVSLEEHMKLVDEYGKTKCNDNAEDPLDVFMERISNKQLDS